MIGYSRLGGRGLSCTCFFFFYFDTDEDIRWEKIFRNVAVGTIGVSVDGVLQLDLNEKIILIYRPFTHELVRVFWLSHDFSLTIVFQSTLEWVHNFEVPAVS